VVYACLMVGAGPISASATAAPSGRAAKVERLAHHLRGDLNGVLARARTLLRQLAALPSVQAGNPSPCSSDMAARAGDPRYTALGAADLTGNLYCLSSPITSPINIADRAYFLRALGTGGLGVGDFQIGRASGQGAIGLGFPVRVDTRLNGIVLTALSLAWLGPHVAAQRQKPARDLLVFDDHGTILADAGPASVAPGTNLGSTGLIKRGLRVVRSAGDTRFGGRRVFAAIDVVPLSGGGLHVAVTSRP
jgi:hypothetical protein